MPYVTNPFYSGGREQGQVAMANAMEGLGNIFSGGDPIQQAKMAALGAGHRKDLAAAALDQDELSARANLGDVFSNFTTTGPDGSSAMVPEADFRAATIGALPDLIRAGQGANVRDILSIPGIASGDDDLAAMGSLFLRSMGPNDAFSLGDREGVASRNAANDLNEATAVQSLSNAGGLQKQQLWNEGAMDRLQAMPMSSDELKASTLSSQYSPEELGNVFMTDIVGGVTPRNVVLPAEEGQDPRQTVAIGNMFMDEAGDYQNLPFGSQVFTAQTSGEGPDAALGFGTKGQNMLDEKIINTDAQLMRIDNTIREFETKYQSIPFKASMTVADWSEKLGRELPPEQQAELTEYAQFRRGAMENLNQTIREITGAQLSPGEAVRISQQLPNPGIGLMDGDGPTGFMAKAKDVRRYIKAAQNRALDFRQKGISIITDEIAAQYPLENYLDEGRTSAVPGGPADDVRSLSDEELLQRLNGG
jgi:hypothetical protein